MNLRLWPDRGVQFLTRIHVPFARFAIFAIYFWFGLLKILGLSPAGPLVHSLFDQTLGFILPFETFYLLFSGFEMLIGILFLFPHTTRLAFILLAAHMITTSGPLVLLPKMIWQAPFVPTLEGQYIIKNLALIATAISILVSQQRQAKNA